MQRRQFLRLAAASAAVPALAAPERPNIVLIMADDMGWSDLGCYGSEIATPTLDRLAANGIRFTQFYNTARCCPTRASLLTGLYPHQAGIGHMMNDYGLPGYRGDLNKSCVTIAEVLKTAGYQTAMTGKWHVTPRSRADKGNWPLQRGFDRFFGTIDGAGSFYNPATLTRQNETIDPETKEFYYTDALGENAVAYIEEFSAKPDPFFLYMAFTAPHWPLHCPEETVAKYKDTYKDGWDTLRQKRFAKQKKLGLVKTNWELTPRDSEVPAWENAPDKEWEARRMAVYAGMVDRLDRAVARVVRTLEQKKMLDNTLILFFADNGGCAEGMNAPPANQPPNASIKPRLTRDGRPVRYGNTPDILPGPEDTYTSYATPWANASNTPFRMYKHWVHEGGISSPLVAHWPAVIRRRNAMSSEPSHLIDLMATCVDLAKAKYPASWKGERIHPMEGKSLEPVFRTGRRTPHEAIYWEHEGNQAIRMGQWKLVKVHKGEWELYDIEADRTELNNLAAAQPERVKAMAAKWEAWAQRANVAPWESWAQGKKNRKKG
jgi:arylsulfatase